MSVPFGIGSKVPNSSEGHDVFSLRIPSSELGSTGYMNGIPVDSPYRRVASAVAELFRKHNAREGGGDVTMILRAVMESGRLMGYDVQFWVKNGAGVSTSDLKGQLNGVFLSEIVSWYSENPKGRVMIEKLPFNRAWMCFESGISTMAESLATMFPGVPEYQLVSQPVGECFYVQGGVQFTSPVSKEPSSRCWAKVVPSWQFSDFGGIQWPHVQLNRLSTAFGMSPSLTELAKAIGPQGDGLAQDRPSKRARVPRVSKKEIPRLSNATRNQMENFQRATGMKVSEDDNHRKTVARVSAWYKFKLLPSLTDAMRNANCLSPAQDGFRSAMDSSYESEHGSHQLLDTVWMMRHLAKLTDKSLPPHLWFYQYYLAAMECYPKMVGTELVALMATMSVFDACNMAKSLGIWILGYSSNGMTGKSNAFLRALDLCIKGVVIFMGRTTVAGYTPETIISMEGKPMIACHDGCLMYTDDASPLLPFIMPGSDPGAGERIAQKEMATSRVCAYSGLNMIQNPDGVGSQRVRQEVSVGACVNRITALNFKKPPGGEIDHAWCSRHLLIAFPETGFGDIANARQREAMSRVGELIEGLKMVTQYQHIGHYIIGQLQTTGLLPEFTTTGASFFMNQVFENARKEFEWAVISSPRAIDRMLRLGRVLAINRLLAFMTKRISERNGGAVSSEVEIEDFMALAPMMIVSWADMVNALCLNDEWVNPFAFAVQAAVRAAIVNLARGSVFDSYIKSVYIDDHYEKDYNYFSVPKAELLNEVARILPEYMGGAVSSRSSIESQLDAMCEHSPVKAPEYWRIRNDALPEAISFTEGSPERLVYPYSKSCVRSGVNFIVATHMLASEFYLPHFNEPMDKLGLTVQVTFDNAVEQVVKHLDNAITSMEGSPPSRYPASIKAAAKTGAQLFIGYVQLDELNPDSEEFKNLPRSERQELIDWLRRRFFWNDELEQKVDRSLNVVEVLRTLKGSFEPAIYYDHFEEMCRNYLKLYKKAFHPSQLAFERETGEGAVIDWYRNKVRRAPQPPPKKNLTLNTRQTVRRIITSTVQDRGQLKRKCNFGARITPDGLNASRIEWVELGDEPKDLKGDPLLPFRIPRVDDTPEELGQRDIELVKKHQEFSGPHLDVMTDLDTKTLKDHFEANDFKHLIGMTHADMQKIGDLMISDTVRRTCEGLYLHGELVSSLIPPAYQDIPSIASALKRQVAVATAPREQPPGAAAAAAAAVASAAEEDIVGLFWRESEQAAPAPAPAPVPMDIGDEFVAYGSPPLSDDEDEFNLEPPAEPVAPPPAVPEPVPEPRRGEVYFDLEYMEVVKAKLVRKEVPARVFGFENYDDPTAIYQISCHPWVMDYISA